MPDQPELRQRLTRVLRDHSETLDIRKYRYGCVCGEWTGANLAEHWGHVADVLLSLPGIAIVELPEPDEVLKHREVFHAAPYRVVAVTGGEDVGFVDVDNRHILYRNARTLAAALLAAAGVAEEQTNA